MKVAIERKSAVLKSNAVHHRVDSLTGIAALISIAMSNLYPTLAGMDALGGLAISFMVIRAGWGNTFTSLEELADASVSAEVKTKVHRVTEQALADSALSAAEVRSVGGTKAGQSYLLEATVALKGSMELQELAAVERLIRERIREKVRGARRIRIRFVVADSETNDSMDEFIAPSESGKSTPEEREYLHHEENGQLNKKDKTL